MFTAFSHGASVESLGTKNGEASFRVEITYNFRLTSSRQGVNGRRIPMEVNFVLNNLGV